MFQLTVVVCERPRSDVGGDFISRFIVSLFVRSDRGSCLKSMLDTRDGRRCPTRWRSMPNTRQSLLRRMGWEQGRVCACAMRCYMRALSRNPFACRGRFSLLTVHIEQAPFRNSKPFAQSATLCFCLHARAHALSRQPLRSTPYSANLKVRRVIFRNDSTGWSECLRLNELQRAEECRIQNQNCPPIAIADAAVVGWVNGETGK